VSRRSDRRRPDARGTAAPAGHSQRRRRGVRWPLWLVVVLVVAAVGWWATVRWKAARPATASLFPSAMADSAIIAYRAQDWRATLYWTRLRAAVPPADPAWILHLAIVSHDYSFAWTRSGRLRPLTRTSLERIELESQALAMADSAIAGAAPEKRWAEGALARGQIYEVLGLPLEALEAYTTLHKRLPDHPGAQVRIAFVEPSLRDPRHVPSGSIAVRTP